MSRKTTGRFPTREELEHAILSDYFFTRASVAQIARACRVSETTAQKIVADSDALSRWRLIQQSGQVSDAQEPLPLT